MTTRRVTMRNIFGWMGMREQQRMLLAAKDHMQEVVGVVDGLRLALEHFGRGELSAVAQRQHDIFEGERAADELRRDLLNKLSEGMFLPADREDLVHLVERVDDIADYANAAARLLVLFREAPPEALRDGVVKYGVLLRQAVGFLADALDKLAAGHRRQTLELCTSVERKEEEADMLKAELYSTLFAMDLPAGTLLLLHNLIESMENTADKAEDAADLIRLLTVKIQ